MITEKTQSGVAGSASGAWGKVEINTHTHTHREAVRQIHSHTHRSQMCTKTHTHTHADNHTYPQTRQRQSHAPSLLYMKTNTQIHAQSPHMYIKIYTQMHTHIDKTDTDTHVYTGRCTQIHTPHSPYIHTLYTPTPKIDTHKNTCLPDLLSDAAVLTVWECGVYMRGGLLPTRCRCPPCRPLIIIISNITHFNSK